MKISITASFLILLVAALYGISKQQRLALVRHGHAQLVAQAAQLGISLDLSNAADPIRITKRGRENKETDAKLLAAEIIAFSKEMESIEKKGSSHDEAMQKRMMEIMERLTSLNSAQLKILIIKLYAEKELENETLDELAECAITIFSMNHPHAALALFTELADLFKDSGIPDHLVSSSLFAWAQDDPVAALEWVRKNSEKFTELDTEDASFSLIYGTARSDPKLAFKLFGELGTEEEISRSIHNIIRAANTPEELTATLAALRGYLKTLPDEGTKNKTSHHAMKEFADQIIKEGYDAGSKWIAQSNFTPGELEQFAFELTYSDKTGESGQWIEWIGKNLSSEKSEDQMFDPIDELVRNWTKDDFQAAGKWLATTPAGPTKNTSIRSYAETISPYEPETAAQWALTLPPGQDRDKTLKKIYNNWPKSDDAAKQAAAAFAKEHGLK